MLYRRLRYEERQGKQAMPALHRSAVVVLRYTSASPVSIDSSRCSCNGDANSQLGKSYSLELRHHARCSLRHGVPVCPASLFGQQFARNLVVLHLTNGASYSRRRKTREERILVANMHCVCSSRRLNSCASLNRRETRRWGILGKFV